MLETDTEAPSTEWFRVVLAIEFRSSVGKTWWVFRLEDLSAIG